MSRRRPLLLACQRGRNVSALDDLNAFIMNRVTTRDADGRELRQFTLAHNEVWAMLELLASAKARECDMYVALSECIASYPGVEGAMAKKRARLLLDAPDARPASLPTSKPPVDAPRTCQNCAGQGWEPSIAGPRRPCGFCNRDGAA